MSFLEKILPGKREEARALAEQYAAVAPRRAADMPVRDFAAALSRPLAVIAEVKHRSPSHPHFRQAAAPAQLAAAYQRGGAAALSVVTDREHFGTSLTDVAAMRQAVELPILTKDFIVQASQIQAAWEAGADAVLLIARLLDQETLTHLLAEAHRLGLQSLVECHDPEDIAKSVEAGARILGINNRNLATLETDLGQTAKLVPLVPAGLLKVSESGIQNRRQVLELAEQGADAFLIGHALLMSRDPGRKVREITGLETGDGPRWKVCGLTRPLDAAAAHQRGADILGLVMAPGPRQVSFDLARKMRQVVPEARLCGVFVDSPLEEVVRVSKGADLDLVQLHGQESPAYCRELQQEIGLPLIKALTLDDIERGRDCEYDEVAYLLLDLPKGEPAEDLATLQEQLRQAARRLTAEGREVFLAGGLNSENIHEALAVAPFAVDLSRGVEKAPGIKDTVRLDRVARKVKPCRS
jgi:indole-3-glycerol phosphate synthase/phosphoribosylanthranilate isomerase